MIIKKSFNRKSISIRISPTGKVVVSAPWYAPDFMINNFVDSKAAWIKERQKSVKKNIASIPKYVEGEPQLFLGEFFPLVIKPIPYIQKSRLGFDGGKLNKLADAKILIKNAKKEINPEASSRLALETILLVKD